MKDWIRNALSIRQPRRPAPVGSLPPVGALILRGPVKMLVTHPLPAGSNTSRNKLGYC